MCYSNSLTGFLLFLCFHLMISCFSGADTISANQSLTGDHTIISKGGNFELGFFKAGKSSNFYIGIWYKKVTSNPPTVVWVANRETPISNKLRSELKIIKGNLVLLNESNFPIWSTNVPISSSSSTAVLLDEGNLVLKNGLNSEQLVWQSFDHPTHTWLPGGKLAYNNITKRSQLLTSWKSSEDPAAGLYSLELVPSEKKYISKWNGSQQYWTSGSWDEQRFSEVPEMRLNYIYNFNYYTNENESYFTYSINKPRIISRFIMDVSGQVQQQTWLEPSKQWNLFWSQPKIQCQVYDFCGAFGTCRQTGLPFCNCLTGFKPRSESDWNRSEFSGGCVRKTDLECGISVKKYDFLTIKVMNLPLNRSVAVQSGEEECRTSCLNNCTCNAYSFGDNECSVWDGELSNLSEDNANGKTIFVKVALKDLLSHKKNNRVIIGTVLGSIGGSGFILALILLIIYIKKTRSIGKMTVEGSLVVFIYRDLQIATKNFSEKLGGGGFGSVFKGVLPDSSFVAVKKLESISQGEKQFRNEVSTIGNIQHVNLIRLRGFCAEGNNKLLVYDYMQNGSLDSHLFTEKHSILNWKTRYQIALGTARGLVYLHKECRDCIIHCDIKPENILLDSDFCPKVADFGLAKIIGRDFSRVLTTMRGTRGYLAPEWLSGVAVTPKADVFSYGMMLFELINGKRNAEQCDDFSKVKFFPILASSVLANGTDDDIFGLLDSRLNCEASVEEVTRMCKVACWCIQDEEDSRPSMSLVEQILEGVLDVNMPPVPRSIQLFVDNTERVVFFTESSSNPSSGTRSDPSSHVSRSTSITSS